MADENQEGQQGSIGMAGIVQKLVGNDPRVKSLAEPEAGAENAQLQEVQNKQVRMEVEQEYDRSVRELERLNPDASENQIEELASAIQGNDAIKVDRVSKEIARTAEEAKAKAERENKGGVDLQAGDSGDESSNRMPTAQSKQSWLSKMIPTIKFP